MEWERVQRCDRIAIRIQEQMEYKKAAIKQARVPYENNRNHHCKGIHLTAEDTTKNSD